MSKIVCRDCKSLDCSGCNIYNLAQMLNAGKFGLIMDENYSIQTENDVAPIRHGKWIEEPVTENNSMIKCSACGQYPEKKDQCYTPFCCLCGAIMDEGINDGNKTI